MNLRTIAKTGLFLLLSTTASASSLLNIDLRDVRDYSKSNGTVLGFVEKVKRCTACWPRGVTYTPYGADRNFDITHENTVFFTYFNSIQPTGAQSFDAQLTALMRVQDALVIRTLDVRFASMQIEVLNVADRAVEGEGWKITIGALQRALVLENATLNFKLVMPAVIGGFAADETKLKLPPSNTQLKVNASNGSIANIFRRTQPAYYQGYPFLQLLNSNGAYTGYGIHAPMDPGVMKRGFWSTGCIRIRMHELYPLFYIVESLKNKFSFRVSTVVNAAIKMEHPYPIWNDAYKRVDRLKPMGEDGLSQMEIIEGRPPLDNLR